MDRFCEDLSPFDNTDHCDCCKAKYPEHPKEVTECETALVDVPMGDHYDAENLKPFAKRPELEYGNCRPTDECCDEPHEYYCKVLGECRAIDRPCCFECEHHVFDPEDPAAYPPQM